MGSGRVAGRVLAGLACGALALPACGDDAPAKSSRRHVMVIDDGFDPSVPVIAGSLAAAYAIACTASTAGTPGTPGTPDAGDAGDGGAPDPDAGAGPSFDDTKAALIADLGRADDSCHLRPGLAPRDNPFADLEPERARWNEAIRHDAVVGSPFATSPLDPVYGELATRLDTLSFHGTATAGLIPHDNPGVRLVLVEQPLGDADDVPTEIGCLVQAQLDMTAALLSDADVRRAFLQRPTSTLDRDLRGARARYGVGIVNESFGHLTRQGLEQIEMLIGCPPVSLRPYFTALTELTRADEDAHREPGVLFVQAAGNDGVQIDGPEDSLDCRTGAATHLLVGSTGAGGNFSFFTNVGACVDVYAPGEDIVAPLPGDWVFPLSGTSFATPLLVRLLTQTAPPPFAPATARAAALGLRDAGGAVPAGHFPADLLYAPAPPAAGSGALVLAAPARPPSVRPPSRLAVDRALWPLRWLARHRGARTLLTRPGGLGSLHTWRP